MDDPLSQSLPWGEVSALLADRAAALFPGGFNRADTWMAPHPPFVSHGRGAHIWDVDGNEYLDLANNFGDLIHGHAAPEVVAAVQHQVALGSGYSLPHEAEISLASLLIERVPGLAQLRFCDSASEAVTLALKAARAFTGRTMIAKFEGAEHGSNDFAEVSARPLPEDWHEQPATVPVSRGTPPSVLGSVLVLPANDFKTCRALLSAHADDLAAVLVDPVPLSCGLQPLDSSFMAGLHVLTRELGILLVYDETNSFRLGYGGAQGRLAGEPGLTVLGGMIGGGYPIGAVAGREDVMQLLASAVPASGTGAGNPISTVAGLAALQHLTRERFRKLDQAGERLREMLAAQINRAEAPLQVTGIGSQLVIHPHRRDITNYRSNYREPAERVISANLYRGLMQRGVVIAPTGAIYLSTALTVADEGRLEDAFGETLKAVA